MTIEMAVIQQNDGTWGYCPEEARAIMERVIVYSDEPGYPTAAAARAAIKRDKSIPRGATVKEYPNARATDGYEPGAASIKITLSKGRIEVRHGTDKVVLAVLERAPVGTWGAIWTHLRALGFEGIGTGR